MEVSRDDEIPQVPATGLESMQASYYVSPGLPQIYSPMYGFDSGMQSGAPYPYYASMYHPQQLYPIAQMHPPPAYPDQTDIMSMIPTLRCWSCTKCGNLNYAHRLTCNLRKCQRMSELGGGPDSDWVCACGNVNYRFRKYCNLRKCQLPQIGNPFLFFGISQLIKAGYAPQTALSLLLTNSANSSDSSDWTGKATTSSPRTLTGPPTSPGSEPSGCWQCKDCGNLNWSWREECNRKGCSQMKKSEGDA